MTTAIYGAGAMGGAILDALLTRGEEVLVVERDPDVVARLEQTDGATPVDVAEAGSRADTHVLAVKPYVVADLLDELAPHLQAGAVVVSVALGITLEQLSAAVPDGVAVVRAMPNTPARVGEGMTVLSPGEGCTDEQVAAVEELLSATGRTLRVPEEHQGIATALSGSAPAYVFLVVEAMVDAGVALGMPRPTARDLAVQAVVGAGALLRETGAEPGELRHQVTSPGGSTAAALSTLEAHGLRHAMAEAVRACAERSGHVGPGTTGA